MAVESNNLPAAFTYDTFHDRPLMSHRLRTSITTANPTATSTQTPITIEDYDHEPLHSRKEARSKETSGLEKLKSIDGVVRSNAAERMTERQTATTAKQSNHDPRQKMMSQSSRPGSVEKLSRIIRIPTSKPRGSGFRPKDTLHSSTPKLALLPGSSNGSSRRDAQRNRDLQSSHHERDRNDFDKQNEQVFKRRKLDSTNEPHNARAHDSINANQTHRDRTAYQQSHSTRERISGSSSGANVPSSQPFDGISNAEVQGYWITGESKGKRGRRRHDGASQDQLIGVKRTHGSPTQSSIDRTSEPEVKKQRVSSSQDQRPSINLERGLETIDAKNIERNRANRHSVVAAAVSSLERSLTTGKQVLMEGRQRLPTMARSDLSMELPEDTRLPLRERSKRCSPPLIIHGANEKDLAVDKPVPPTARTKKRKDCMNIHSSHEVRLAKVEDDELADGNLITSTDERSNRQNAHQAKEQLMRRLVAVESTSSNAKSMGALTRESNSTAPESMVRGTSLHPIHNIPIKMFVSRHFQKRSRDLTLVWSDGTRDFTLHADEQLVRINRSGAAICLIGSNRFLWYHAVNDRRVCISPTRGDQTSADMIVVEFTDMKGQRDCLETVEAEWNRRVELKEVTAGHLEVFIEEFGSSSDPQVGSESKHDGRRRLRRRSERANQSNVDGNQSTSPIEITESPENTRLGRRDQSRQDNSSPIAGLFGENNGSIRQSRRLTERKPIPIVERWSQINPLKPWQKSVVYPSEGVRRVTVDFQDLERLDEGEFLNDNLIAFGLRRIEEKLPPEWATKVHFFNTYFFTSLSEKSGVKGFNYDAVRKWTKNKDLLSTPYIVVPINHDLHWYVAIICNLPQLKRQIVIEPEQDELHINRSSPMLDTSPLLKHDSPEVGNTAEKLDDLTLTDGDQARRTMIAANRIEDNKDAITPASTPRRGGKRHSRHRIAPVKKFDPESPAILVLDSLAMSHSSETAMLKDYIIAEAKDKRQVDVERSDMQGINVKNLPMQNNYCDCGVYVIAYLEAFARDPRRFIERAMQKENNAEEDFPDFDPSEKRKEIRDELLKLAEEQHSKQKSVRLSQSTKPADSESGKASSSKAVLHSDGYEKNNDQLTDAHVHLDLGKSILVPRAKAEEARSMTNTERNPAAEVEDHAAPDLPSTLGTPPGQEHVIPATPSTVKPDESQELEMEVPRPYTVSNSQGSWSFQTLDKQDEDHSR